MGKAAVLTYRVVNTMERDSQLLLLRHRFTGSEQLWTLGRARKATRCTVTCHEIKPGQEVWRPITNASNRMDRISADGMLQLVADYQRGAAI